MRNAVRSRLAFPDDPEERGRVWREHVAPVFDVEFGRQTALDAPLMFDTTVCGDMLIARVQTPVQRLTRTPRKIARQGLDHVLLQFIEAGSNEVQGRGAAPARASQVVVFDMARPVETEVQAVKALNLVVPRSMLVDMLGGVEHLHRQAFDFTSDPVRHMLHRHMCGLLGALDPAEPHRVVDLSEAVAALCRTCLPRGTGPELPSGAIRKLAIKRYVEERIGAPDVDIARVVERFGLSRPTLQRLFKDEGGFASYVRERRLCRAFASFAHEDAARRRVSAVAYAHGFLDLNTFSRAFRRRFGMAPRDVTADTVDALERDRGQASLLSLMNRL